MATFDELDATTRTELEAAAFRRLLKHLDDNKDVQNIDLMILADFCRNCLSKWLVTAADERYGMPYSEWKANHQGEATPEQLAALEARQAKKKANASPNEHKE